MPREGPTVRELEKDYASAIRSLPAHIEVYIARAVSLDQDRFGRAAHVHRALEDANLMQVGEVPQAAQRDPSTARFDAEDRNGGGGRRDSIGR